MSKTKVKRERMMADPARGYALVVGGPQPYVSRFVPSLGNPNARAIAQEEITEPYHCVKHAVVLTLADYRQLLKAARKSQ